MKNKIYILVFTILLLGACRNEIIDNNNNITLNLQVNSRAVEDANSINQDETFTSIAIYIYNNDETNSLYKSELLPKFDKTISKDIVISCEDGLKFMYIIGNYANKTYIGTNGSITYLNESTQKRELDNMIIKTRDGLIANSLLMIGAKELIINSENSSKTIDLEIKRLQSRVDIHVFKQDCFKEQEVVLKSITLHNIVLNSKMNFNISTQLPEMVNPPLYNTERIEFSTPLTLYSPEMELTPQSASASFYSYQNLAHQSTTTFNNRTYITIEVEIDGEPATYKGYITDENQIDNKYSLLQNNVYQVCAILESNLKLIQNIEVLDWNKTSTEIDKPVSENDYSFSADEDSWGGENGKTINSITGDTEDAIFKFKLAAPKGTKWSATLSNSIDFSFVVSSEDCSESGVSNGVADNSEKTIIIRANKRWQGVAKSSEFYIIAGGKELIINPIVNSKRKYLGSDTRILIKQVASKD